jgi:hypothetical protein
VSLNDLPPFTFAFTPTLKNGENIQAIVCFFVGGRTLGHLLAMCMTSRDLEPAREEIRQSVFAESCGIVSRWALRFRSADDAVDLSSYSSLTHELSAIASRDFIIRKLIVREIISLSPPLVPKVEEPPVTEPITKAITSFKLIKHLRDDLPQSEPELWNDPFLGGITTPALSHGFSAPQEGKLKKLIDKTANGVMDGPK